jgi:hypothetical protein
MIKRKMELDIEVQRLRILESQYRAERYSLEDDVLKRLPTKLAELTVSIKGLETDIIRRDAHTGEDGEFHMRLGKHEFTERKDACETLLKAINSNQYADKVIGFYRGFEIIPQEKSKLTDYVKLTLKGDRSYTIELSDSDVGCIARIENGLNSLEKLLTEKNAAVIETERRMEASKVQLQRPFEHEEALQVTLSELDTVNSALDVGKSEDADAVVDENMVQGENDDFLGLDEEETEDCEDEPEM